MRKVIKIIPVYFLWFAWLVVMAHLIIPHDHHLNDSFGTKDDICPVSNGKTGHSSHAPLHCHAFNDLTSEKATTFLLAKVLQDEDFIISRFSDISAFGLQIHGVTICNLQKPCRDLYFLEFSLLRAPPSLS
jgi:hypothetical protein